MRIALYHDLPAGGALRRANDVRHFVGAAAARGIRRGDLLLDAEEHALRVAAPVQRRAVAHDEALELPLVAQNIS